MNDSNQFCTFEVGGLLFGLEVAQVQEVMRFQEMTPVPVAPPEIAGLINLRGQIVTAIDMRRRLNFEPRNKDERPMNVVLTEEYGAVSLLVDQIGDVLDLNETDFEDTPNTLDPEVSAIIRRVYKLDDKLLLLIDAAVAAELSGSGGAAGRPSPGKHS